MGDESKDAQRYERLYPGTDAPEAQKQERQERIDFREEVGANRRTSRTRGIVVPALPWHKNEE